MYGTDYSVGRAEPLKVSLKTASTCEKADEPVVEQPKRKKEGEE